MAENVLLTIQGDIRDIKSKFAQVESIVKKISGTTQKQTNAMSSRFQNLGGIIKTVFAAAIIYKFMQGLKETAKAASNLEEQTAKFKTVFRGSLEGANQDVKDLTENYAMSTREARQYMAAVQDLLVPMGMARDQAAGFSGEIVKLSADLGSFNNLPTAQVMDNIASALTGQYRAVRKYGVVLLDEQVRQRAVNDGLALAKDEVTALDKAMTAYRMILEQTADAQGDMARTADSFANTMKRTNAAVEDFKAAVGQYVIPALGFWAEKATTVLHLMEDIIGIQEETPKAATMWDDAKNRIQALKDEIALLGEQYDKDLIGKFTYNRELVRLQEELVWWTTKLNELQREGRNINYFGDAEKKAKKLKEEAEKTAPIFDPKPIVVTRKELRNTEVELELYLDEMGYINKELGFWEENANRVGGAMAGTFTQIISGANSAEEAIRRLAFQMAALAATSFIPGGWGQFLGGFLGMLGAPAPSLIRQPQPKIQAQTVGQQRQNITYSTPMYGRRFIREMNRGAVNVDSISAWSLA